jgi:hypothetical protein
MKKNKKEIELECYVCKNIYKGEEPRRCCNGQDCGCMGMPIDPPTCSKECWDKLMSQNKLNKNNPFI